MGRLYMAYITVVCKICDYIGFITRKIHPIPSSTVTEENIMESPTAESVKEMIKQDKVVIFSKTYCPYCKMAKEVFDQINQKYTVVELDTMDEKEGTDIQLILGEITGVTTVPRVFVNGECLGGGSDVKALLERGELQRVLSTL